MANGFFQHGVKHFALGDIVWKATGGDTPRTALIDTADYTVDLANHEFLTSVAAAAREETSGNMTLVDAAADGVVDASDIALVGTAGDQCEGILVYDFETGDSDSALLFWWDSAPGLPVTLGGDVDIVWPNTADRIARI